MQILSALDAISPAMARTRLILFSPFRKGRTWKLAGTAYLSRAGTMFVPFPLLYLFFLPSAHRAGGTPGAALLVVGLLLFTALWIFLFHLCSRLGFAFFDIVLNRGEFVAPAWRLYGPQSRKWTAVKVLLGSVATAAFAVPTAAYLRNFFPLMSSMQPGQPPSPEFLASIFAGYAILYLGIGFFYIVSSLLGDFIVPSLALENTTLQEAFRRFVELVRREPGQFTAYTLLKTALGIGIYLGAFIAFEIVVLLAVLILVLVAGGIGYLLHLAGVPTIVLTGLAIFIGVVCYLFIVVYVALIVFGTVFVFFESYNLYFLGGRYPLLGDLLDRSTPPPVAPLSYYPPGQFPPPPPPVPA